jgi:hypothetical protein
LVLGARSLLLFGVYEVVVFGLDEPVAVAGDAFKLGPITNGDHSAGVPDEPFGLESAGDL